MIGLGIANSSAFIGLGRIGRLDILRDSFSRIVIPKAVADEIGDVPCWVTIEEVREPRMTAALPRFLHAGEAQVILLGIERPESVLVLDDGYAREFARSQNLNFIGTVGLLLRGKREGRLALVLPVLQELTDAGFRVSDRVIAETRRLSGE